MRNLISTGAAILAATYNVANACEQDSKGNSYCESVSAIQYTNWNFQTTYTSPQFIDGASGSCPPGPPQTASGPLAPLSDELSLVVRGPATIKKVAVYQRGSSTSKRSRVSAIHRRHGHGHAHFHAHDKEIREIQDQAEKREEMVVPATINGVEKMITINPDTWAAAATDAPVPAPVPIVGGGGSGSSGSGAAKAPWIPKGKGDWVKQAFYDAEKGVSKGLTFMGNYGGPANYGGAGSGVFDALGNSLSFLAADGISGGPSSQVLSDTFIPSNKEFSIFSDKPCSGGSCGGILRQGVPNYQGWSGDKVFMLEFSMPYDTNGTFSGPNPDMPAIWALNSQILRQGQYTSCTCWKSGCGELDLFEVLAPGFDKAITAFHGNEQTSKGSNAYFPRPADATKQAAVIFSGDTVSIQYLDDAVPFKFPGSFAEDTIGSMISSLVGSVSSVVMG